MDSCTQFTEYKNDLRCPETDFSKLRHMLPYLLDVDLRTLKNGIKLSILLSTFKLTTEELLERLKSNSRKYKVGTKNDIFSRCPEAIIFQNFKTGVTYSTTITVKNQSKVPQNLKVYFESSKHFSLSMDHDKYNVTKIAPGMSHVYNVTFQPTDDVDYIHNVHFTSDDFCFSVPLYGLGPTAYVYVPDKIVLPPTLVKVESTRSIILKNTGRSALDYSSIIYEPFSCSVPRAIIEPNKFIELNYSCYPLKPGLIVGQMDFFSRYDLRVVIDLECEVKSIKIQLDPQYIIFDEVYMGLCTRKALMIHNTSEYPLNFVWKINDEDEEKDKILKLVDLMEAMKEYEQNRYEKLAYLEIVDGQDHANIYERIFQDEKEDLLSKQNYLYESEYFEIIPKVGKILPKSSFEFAVIFSPRQNISYSSTAYLDIEGTEKRVPVLLQGYGIGPPVILNVNNLIAGQLYLTDKHQYEIAVMNKGVIHATVTYQPKKTDWGGVITCIPTTLQLGPDSTKAFIIVFYSEHQGAFLEILDFTVEESGDHLQCIFSGDVICPLLKVFPDKLDCGIVSVGLTNTKEIYLVNESRVSIKYDFEFEEEFEEFANENIEIIPRHGKVRAASGVKVKVSFCCNTASTWKTNLDLVMWNSRMYTIKIPFTFSFATPLITCHPESVNIKFCFLHCEYSRMIKLMNCTDLPGYVEYVPNKEEKSAITCQLNKTKLFFDAQTCIAIKLKIKISDLGEHKLPLKFIVIGEQVKTLCTITCCGQGPVVSYYPDEVEFGLIDVLSKYEKMLTLVNDSPITAKIRVYCKNHNPFYIEENEGTLELQPEEQTDVAIRAMFKSPGKFRDTICIEIYQSDICTVKVSGEGIGTSIQCEPPLVPSFKFGALLTYNTYTQEIKLTNKGIIRHKLFFTQRSNIRSIKEIEDMKATSTFCISPQELEIPAGGVGTVAIKCCSRRAKHYIQEYFCYAIIGKSIQAQMIFIFFLEAEFRDPELAFSKPTVSFNLEVVRNVAEGRIDDTIHVSNKTGIPLQVHISVNETDDNFTIVNGTELTKHVDQDLMQNPIVLVHYTPTLKNKRKLMHNAKLIFEYMNHPKTDVIDLRGEVTFPTVKLYPNLINFHCMPLGSTSHKIVVIQNISKMKVNFKWFWLEERVQINSLDPVKDSSKIVKVAQTASVRGKDFMEYIDFRVNPKDNYNEVDEKESAVSYRFSCDVPEGNKVIYDNELYLEQMRNILSSVLFSYKSTKNIQLNPVDTKELSSKRITKWFSIEPSEGFLMPYEYTVVTIGFIPPLNTQIEAIAICKIHDGDEETLFLTGKSSKVSYTLDKSCVTYGNQVFCERCTDSLTLNNNGLCSINYKVLFEESVSMQTEMLDVEPKNGCLASGDSITFKVNYFPGTPGIFHKCFTLELSYLEPVIINVHGYAVLSQVFLLVPRPDMQLDIADCYKAIAWITPEYLELVAKIHGNNEIEDECTDEGNFLENNGWVYISYKELYPTAIDINMAMERISAFNLVREKPRLLKDHTVSKKIPYIPFFAPVYYVDFGYVIRDIAVCYTVLIYNYGPISTEINLVEDNKTSLLEKEIKIEYKRKPLAPGETIDLYIIFSPTKRKCLELNKKIEDSFRLTVKHGPIITVQIKGEVTLPTVSLEHQELDFGRVYCGDVLRKTVVLTNDGNVLSKWFATILKSTKKGDPVGYFIIPTTGELEPGTKTFLDIYFLPVNSRRIRRVLQLDVESNAEPILMSLVGEGFEASLVIVPDELNFQPTICYLEQSLYFAVQNMSEIPLEFYFPSLDSVTENEKLLIQIYLKYKNLKHLFVPLRKAGKPLPDFLTTTYNHLIEKLRNKMISMMAAEIQIEESDVIPEAKISKIRKSDPFEDPLAKYTEKELGALLMEYISAEGLKAESTIGATNSTTLHGMDDSSEKIEIIEGPPNKSISDEIERNAALFVVHGEPSTDYYKVACKIGIELSFPVYSIDRLIIEALVENVHPLASDILEIIETTFMGSVDYQRVNEILAAFENEESEYDNILDKVNIILAARMKKHPNKKNQKEEESRPSSEKSQAKTKDKLSGDCFLNISSDYFAELLKPKMKTIPHLIIESLNSIFIPLPLALPTILKAVGNIYYINFIMLSYTTLDFIKNEEERSAEVNKSKLPPPPPPPPPVPDKPKGAIQKIDKASLKVAAEKIKAALQHMNKTLRAQLDEFEAFRQDIYHLVQYWDKKNALLRQPFLGAKKEFKDSAKIRPSIRRQSEPEPEEDSFEPGIYAWFILNSTNERSIDFPEMIRNCIREDVELQRILSDIAENEKPKFEESETSFSIISKPSTRKNASSSVFTIKNYQGKESYYPLRTKSRSGSSLRSKRKRSSRSSRKSVDSRSFEVALTFAKTENDVDFSPRAIIQPGELIKYQVTYYPKKCGVSKYRFMLEDVRSKASYSVICNAVCEFPRIDLNPEVMYPKTLQTYKEKATYDHFVFIKDMNIFDFGYIIAGQNLEKSIVYSSNIVLQNASSSVCEVTPSLSNDIFYTEPANLIIPPNEESQLQISVRSTKVGTYNTLLYISVKNNPKVECFTLACTSCKLDFSIYPKLIQFDKVPVSYSSKRMVRLTNSSPINLRWEFIEPGWVTDIFNLSQASGHLGLYSVSDIVFGFHPKEEIYFPKRALPIRVYDVNSANCDPCYADSIIINADSVEYNINVENHIDYGEIKGGVDHKRNFAITNKGKCDVTLKIDLINNPLDEHNFVRDYFRIQPLLLCMGSQKTDYLSITFRPKRNFSVQNILIFVVTMVEDLQSGQIVKSYKVTMSASTFMPCFKVCPQFLLNFGYVPLNSSRTLKLDLVNRGKFGFSFNIVNYTKMAETRKKEMQDKKQKKEDNRRAVSVKESKKKSEKETRTKSEKSKTSDNRKQIIKSAKVNIGAFSLCPSNGVIYPNETCEIDVEVRTTETIPYKEQILVNIAEIENIKDNRVLTLEAIGCEPAINLSDFESVFMEQFVVSHIEDFVMPKNVDGCCIFSSSECVLYFKQVCVGTKLTIKIHFKNIGYVSSYLTAKIDDLHRTIFTVAPSFIALEPHASCFFEITFKPRSLESVTEVLEMSYDKSTDNKLIIQLKGQACLPQIELIKPIAQMNEALINFSPLCIGFTRKEHISIKNVGSINCNVILELATCSDALTIVPCSNTLKMSNIQHEDCLDIMKRHTKVNLLVDEIADFELVHKPIKQESIEAVLSLHTLHNPYEVTKIIINAFSFEDDIILEDLEAVKLIASESSNSSLVPKNTVGYSLDLGYRQLNKLCKKSFLIRNRSDVDIYKFRFYSGSVLFVPEVGHLKPGAFKEVLVIFKATSPVLMDKVESTCNISKIEYVNPDPNLLSWDDRQKFVYWINDPEYSPLPSPSTIVDKSNPEITGKTFETAYTERYESKAGLKTKVIMEGEEPEINTLPNSFIIIPLYLTVSADYCKYKCETKIIDFPDTYINEEISEEFNVENIGTIPITIMWTLSDKSYSFTSGKKSNSEICVTLNIFDIEASLKSASSSSLNSGSYVLQAKSCLPFAISPEKTIIEPGSSKMFNITFCPQETNSFETVIKASIDALDPNLEDICIELNANALPIPFYFEMEDGSSTNKDIILNFENIGVGTESVRTVVLVNPNSEQVSFEIVPKDKSEFSYFACNIPKGSINSNKKYVAIFSFRPPIFGSFKENYTLKIAAKDVEKNILLQGLCREPRVYFSENLITLKPTVVNIKVSKSLKLINEEVFAISYKFSKKSLYSESEQEKLEVYPIVGKLKPQSENDVKITFTSENIASPNFHVKCMVEKLKSPLNLHISARSLKVQSSVTYVDKNGGVVSLSEEKVNIVDLGYTYKGRRDIIYFEIKNEGQVGMFYKWDFDPKPVAHLFKLSVEDDKGFIKSNETGGSNLICLSIRTGSLKQFKINLKILYGPVYVLHVNAFSDKPSYSFSFDAYDFGNCLTQNGETSHYSTVLSFKNLDSKNILVENLFEKTDYLTVEFTSSTVKPGGVRNIPVKFYPQKEGSYKSEVLFRLGGNKHVLLITGEAVNIKLELCKPKDKFINFGEILVQTIKKYRVEVCNQTSAKFDVHFDFFDNLVNQIKISENLDKNMKVPVAPSEPLKIDKDLKKKDLKKKDEKEPTLKPDLKISRTKSLKEIKQPQWEEEDPIIDDGLVQKQREERQKFLKSFMIVPSTFTNMPPRGKGYFDIIFQPTNKIEFEEKIYFETQDYFEPICVIKGSSIIADFSLDQNELFFGGVIVDCCCTKLINLRNSGDIVGSFSWRIEDKRQIFSIEPKQGFVLPTHDTKIKITFCPRQKKCEYRVKAKCTIKEIKEPLELILKGNAVKIPDPTATVKFSCYVRTTVSDNSVIINNNTSGRWEVETEISHEAFSAPKEMLVLPFTSAEIPITYSPVRMTMKNPDEGKIFIKMPDGGGLLYNLIGNAQPPLVKKKIEKEIPSKQNVFEIIPIENWLTVKQTFKIVTELITPITSKTLYKIFGPKSIELHGKESRNYKWGIYVVNEGVIELRITFKNLSSGEYEFFEISLKALPSEPIETIFLKTKVREPVTKQIHLENPIDIPVTYMLDYYDRSLSFPKSIKLEPYTTAKVDITYKPFQTETTSITINAKCEELGTYSYLIKMHGEPPKIEECINFISELGGKAAKNILFNNIFDRPVEFSYKFEHEEFYTGHSGPILVGESSNIAITFEPSILGHFKSRLVLTSFVTGEFIYPLDGKGILPSPKGPFDVKSQYPAIIEFKNPFHDDKQFKYHLSPNIFCCDFDEDIIKSKKTARFIIYVRPGTELASSYPETGKLIIYALDEPEIQWKYYLQFNQNLNIMNSNINTANKNI